MSITPYSLLYYLLQKPYVSFSPCQIIILKNVSNIKNNPIFKPCTSSSTHEIILPNNKTYYFTSVCNNWIYLYTNDIYIEKHNGWNGLEGWQGDHFTIGYDNDLVKLHKTEYTRNTNNAFTLQRKFCDFQLPDLLHFVKKLKFKNAINTVSCRDENKNIIDDTFGEVFDAENDDAKTLRLFLYTLLNQTHITHHYNYHLRKFFNVPQTLIGGEKSNKIKKRNKDKFKYNIISENAFNNSTDLFSSVAPVIQDKPSHPPQIDENVLVKLVDFYNTAFQGKQNIHEIHILLNTESKQMKSVFFTDNEKIVSPIESISKYINTLPNVNSKSKNSIVTENKGIKAHGGKRKTFFVKK